MAAETWRTSALAVQLINTSASPGQTTLKSLIDVRQNAGGSKVIRLYRIWHSWGATAGNNPGIVTFRIASISAGSNDRSNIPLRPARNTNASISPPVSVGTNRGYQEIDIYRHYIRSQAAITFTTGLSDDSARWEYDVPIAMVWDAGYLDSNVQPLTIRGGYGVHVRQTVTTVVTGGQGERLHDLEMEFTVASS